VKFVVKFECCKVGMLFGFLILTYLEFITLHHFNVSTFQQKSKMIIRRNHQINDNPGNCNVQPDRECPSN
jgi:hypothetical protein